VSAPKRHHIISEMLQSRFTDETGQLYFFDKRNREKGVQHTGPNNLFVKRHAYSLLNPDGTKDTSLETHYSQIEGVANEIIEKILTAARSGKVPHLTKQEKRDWDNFVHHQWKRSPDFQASAWTEVDFETSLKSHIEEFEQRLRPLTDEERALLESAEGKSRLRHNATVGALSDPGPLAAEALDSRGLGIAHIRTPTKSFVIGTSPVVKLTHRQTPELTHPTTEMWLPISADIAVSPAGESGAERLVVISDERHVRAINTAIAKQSTVIAGRSRALLVSLASPR
jgi:hypothetical protein